MATELSKENLERIFSDISVERSSRPLYHGDYEELIEVCQGEFGMTRADDAKPVLAAYRLGPCVEELLYHPKFLIFCCHSYEMLQTFLKQIMTVTSTTFNKTYTYFFVTF